MTTYTVKLRAAIQKRKDAMRYVAVNAIQDVMDAAMTPQKGVARTGGTFIEGRIPVVEADLIQSQVTRINGSETGGSVGSYAVALAGFDFGDDLEFAWTAPHANRIERGFTGTDALGRKFNVPGRHFVGKNVERFSDFCKKRQDEVSE